MRRVVPLVVVAALLLLVGAFYSLRSSRLSSLGAGARPDLAQSTASRVLGAPLPLRLSDGKVSESGGRFTLTGRVLSTANGHGVGGAVLVLAAGEGAAVFETRADADGAFRWTTDAAGTYQLSSLTADGYVPFEPELGTSPLVVVAHAGVTLSDITLYLVPLVATAKTAARDGGAVAILDGGRGTLGGKVVDERGAPAIGARVYASSSNDTQRAITDEQGRFTISGLAAMRYDVVARQPDATSEELHDIAIGRNDLVLTLATAGRVVGQVRDADAGKPLVAFTIIARQRVGAMQRGDERQLSFFDPEGRYVIAGLRPGMQCLVAVAFGRAASKEQCVDVPKGGEARAEFALGRGAKLTGRVFDRVDKQPIARARVLLESAFNPDSALPLPVIAATETSADGTFTLTGLPSGVRSIFVTADKHHSRVLPGLEVDADRAPPPLEIDLAPTAANEDPRIESAGINAAVRAVGDTIVIDAVTPEGGAGQAGLLAGDVILRVDGAEIASFSGMAAAVERMRGPEGSTVILTIRRPPAETTTDVVVVRRRVLNR